MIKKFSVIAFGIAAATNFSQASVPTLAETFTTNILVDGGTSSQRSKIDSAETKIRNIVRTQEFKDRVINFTYNGVKRFVDNGGLTNTQIYYKILNAAELAAPTLDNEMDLKVRTYYQNSSTVGYTSNGLTIYFNTKFLNGYTIAEAAKTLTHEWLHKIGFRHAVYYSTSRDYSVPYGIGRIMKELALKY